MVSPTSFAYGNSIDASRFVQLEEMDCNFQPLNMTFQVQSVRGGFRLFVHVPLVRPHHFFFLLLMWFQAINKGPSRLLGSTVDIRIPNRLFGSGADMFHIIETQVDANSSPSVLFTVPGSLFITLSTCRQPCFQPQALSALLPTAKSPMWTG